MSRPWSARRRLPGSSTPSPALTTIELLREDGRRILGPTLAEGAVVSHAVVRDSIVNAGARVERAVLDRSIIGEQATVSGRPIRISLGESSVVEVG